MTYLFTINANPCLLFLDPSINSGQKMHFKQAKCIYKTCFSNIYPRVAMISFIIIVAQFLRI